MMSYPWYHNQYHTYDIMYDIYYDMIYDIIGQCSIRSTAASRAPAAAAASLRRFLVSAALVLLSLSRSALIISASVIDTIQGRPRP